MQERREARRLAAIMATDIVGYSRLIEADEKATLAAIRSLRSNILDPAITEHNGRIVKLMGDGAIVEFGSVVDAVSCAVAIQRGAHTQQSETLPERRIAYRIGVNLGDVVVEGDDLMGDGVNIAARLEQICPSGGLLVSAAAYDQLQGKIDIPFDDVGERQVKNITRPVHVYSARIDGTAHALPRKTTRPRWLMPVGAVALLAVLVAGGGGWWFWPATTAGAKPSLVVLPFDNMNDDKEQEYLANGFTEDLTTELARLPGLFVVSRNAAFAYKDKETKPAEIAAALGVRYLLEGSIRRVGDNMRINAQLIDGTTSGHLWAERFDGQWAEVFALQDKVVESIAGALKLRLMNSAPDARAGGTNNPAAYDAYLKALDIYNRDNTTEEFAEVVERLQQAVRLDPDFGAAYAQLAWAYWEADVTRAVMMGLTEDEASRKLHETLKLAARHPSPGYYQLVAGLMVREHNSDEAVTVLLKSVALDPSDPWNYLSLANALNFNGRPKEALSYLDAAARVDPNSWMDYRRYQAGLAEFGQGRFEEAIQSIERVDLQSPDPWMKFYALHVLASAYGHLGRTDQSASALKKLRNIPMLRWQQGPNLLIAQDYMVFKKLADTERLLEGLTKAGVPDLPALASGGMKPKDRLTGAEINSLIFGHETRGRLTYPKFFPMQRTTSANGAVSETVGARTREGTSWLQGNFLCNAFPVELTSCGAIYRNPFRTPGRQDEYIAVYRSDQFEFSIVR